MMCGAIIIVASTILFCIHDNNKDIQNKIENIEHEKNLNESCPRKFTTNKSSTEKSQIIPPTEEDYKCYGALDTQKLFVNEIKFHNQSLYCSQQQKNGGMKEKTMVSLPTKQLLNFSKNEIPIVETVVEIKDNKTTTKTTTTTTNENKNQHLQVFIQGYFDALQRMLNIKRWYLQQTESSTQISTNSTILTAC